jgi:glutathione S-transferase
MWVIILGSALAAGLWWGYEKSQRRTWPVGSGLRSDITLPHTQEFELYHNALSLCSMKSRVCMAELQIPYASHHVHLIETGSYENIGRPFLAVNRAGTVPVLVHEGHPIYESHEQIRYAAAHAPPGSPELVPQNEALRAEMEQWVDRSSLTDDPLTQGNQSIGNAVPPLTVPLFATMIEQISYSNILEGLLFHIDRRRPLIFLTLKLLGIDRLPKLRPISRILARTHRQVSTHLDALEAMLNDRGGPWILGEMFTLADVGWLVVFERLRQAVALEVFLGGDKRPACAAYWERLQKRPSYQSAILESGHPTIDYGMERLAAAKRANPALRELLDGSRT